MRPQSFHAVTDAGRKTFNDYLSVLEEIVSTGKS